MTIREHIIRIKARGFKYKEDKEIAIRSLEAWEKVRSEIQLLADEDWNKKVGTESGGLETALEIIDKNLQEVTTDTDSD